MCGPHSTAAASVLALMHHVCKAACCTADLALMDCLHAAVHVGADGQAAEMLEGFSQDEQLVYGVSWSQEVQGLLATASFYDRRLRLWQMAKHPAA